MQNQENPNTRKTSTEQYHTKKPHTPTPQQHNTKDQTNQKDKHATHPNKAEINGTTSTI